MKVREDFVSNSSSTSFVLSLSKDRGLEDLVEEVAKASVNKKYQYHNDKVECMNYANLLFNLFHYELLFLGSYVARTSEDTIAKRDLPLEVNGCCVFDENDWQIESRNIEMWKKLKDRPDDDIEKLSYSFASKDYIDGDEVLHKFFDYDACRIAVDMKDHFSLSRNELLEDLVSRGEASEEQLKIYEEGKQVRLQAIREISCQAAKDDTLGECRMKFPRTYQITMNTLKNTHEMVEAGFKLKFEKWEDIDGLEKRLKDGQRLFFIANDCQGSGWSNDAVYSEEGSLLASGQFTKIEAEKL